METVRLTIQVRDHGNTTRVTLHRDVPLKDVENKAAQVAGEITKYFRKEKRAQAEATK